MQQLNQCLKNDNSIANDFVTIIIITSFNSYLPLLKWAARKPGFEMPISLPFANLHSKVVLGILEPQRTLKPLEEEYARRYSSPSPYTPNFMINGTIPIKDKDTPNMTSYFHVTAYFFLIKKYT